MADLVELELPARPDVLALARLVVAAVVSIEPSFDEERVDDLRLAVSEACTNAIEAQLRVGSPAAEEPIVLRCTLEEGRAEVEVRDHGPGFDPSSLRLPAPLTDASTLEFDRGLGVPLIRLLSDEVDIRSSGDGTTVAMTFEARLPG